MYRIFATTTRGLEAISESEMARVPGLEVKAVGYRRIEAEFTGQLGVLLDLRTVDDVFLRLAQWKGIKPQRTALADLRAWASALAIEQASEPLRCLRPVESSPSFSVTVNFVGKRNYSADEVKLAVADEVAGRCGWSYGEENETAYNLRIFIEHEEALVGLRLSQHPMHSRSYKQAHISGSLKPPVAAAMLAMLDPWPGGLVLDPFCGAGTIPIEAVQSGLTAVGGDREVTALEAARGNARTAGVTIDLAKMDAQSLPLAAGSVDFVATNLPWGRQVQTGEPLAELYQQTCVEIERVLAGRGRAALLTSLPELVRFRRLALETQVEISLYGQRPWVMVYGKREGEEFNRR